jgi:hypothetical protein
MAFDFDSGSLPQLDLLKTLNSCSMTSNLDPDLNIPLQTNFNYYTMSDFTNSYYDIANCSLGNYFSVMHSNIRSMNANFDGLMQMLAEVNHSFSLIGLTVAYGVDPSRNTFREGSTNKRRKACPAYVISVLSFG